MNTDPHENGTRLIAFKKIASHENYLADLNQYMLDFPSELGELDVYNNYPIIYIVGLPRSGTTLLSQLVSRCFPVGYINNLIARFWLNPIAGIRLSQAILGEDSRKKITLKSIHGVSEDPWGPHEFGYFWRHWLKLDESKTHKLSIESLSKIDREGLTVTLNRMAGAFCAPLVFKNIVCGLQASFLTELRPRSLFVYIERDPEDVAISLLRARKERYGDETVWWSLKPSTFDSICTLDSSKKQIECQIRDGAREFDQELSKPGISSIRLSYASLCADPESSLQLIAQATSSLGYPMSVLNNPIPLISSTSHKVRDNSNK